MPSKDVPIHSQTLPRLVDEQGLALREDVLYSDSEGNEKEKLRKKMAKPIERLREIVVKCLQPNEAILFIAPAQEPISTVQQMTLGWMAYQLTRTMLVVTNVRVLAFHLKVKSFGRWAWDRAIRSIRFGDIAESKVKPGFLGGTMELRYRNGKKEKYWRLARNDAKKIKLIFEKVLPNSLSETTAAQGSVALCPQCLAVLPEAPERCARCQTLFATRGEMIKRSLLWPGGGYFYVGQKALGVLDALGESIWIGAVILFLFVAAGYPEPFVSPLEEDLTASGGDALFPLGMFLFILLLEKLLTILHGGHFVQKPYALDKPPNPVKWATWGMVVYLFIGGLVFLVLPDRNPLLQVAPDVAVHYAEFGLFSESVDGTLIFIPTTSVPKGPNVFYGFVLRVRTPRPQVKLHAEMRFPGIEQLQFPPGQNPFISDDLENMKGGVISRYWKVQEDEPAGQQTLNVSIEGVQVKTFHFEVK